ncbi:TIGR00341 family protein [Halococcus sp. IIIV-5B]|uniref:TIGR00341 family protein n=1 Tax=Halococcus sp. IIIV-5B TaxID=2321230 RepID=UPI000E7560E8|nr:TIGR00341 family protein [Halococcus sp. IIIV-5B]RJT06105.1 TIGR00341 family protein [Halococcus sp. IIIV-5B]
MRLIKLVVPDGQRETVLDVLRTENIDRVVTEDASERDASTLVEFPLPTQAVEYVLGELREAGLDDTNYTVIATAETAKTTHYNELENRFVAGVEEDDSVAHEEIRAKALDMHRNPLTYYAMTLFSAVVAAAGLLLNSAAIVVGAMVIAPQVGSAMMSSVGIVLNDRKLIGLGLKSLAGGLTAAVLAGTVLAFALKAGGVVPTALDVSAVAQVSQRTSPGLLALAVAVCAGAAGAFGLSTGLSEALVGVMIAAALIPAAAAVGIGVAWGLPAVALGALALLVVNTVAVNLAGVLALVYLGYRPWMGNGTRSGFRRLAPALGALAVLLAVFAVSGTVMAGQVSFDRDINDAVETTLDRPAYAAVDLETVRTQVILTSLSDDRREVAVVVSRPTGESYPGLPQALAERIETRTGHAVDIELTIHDRRRFSPD